MENERLDQIRHSFAHLLAAAILDLYPDAKPTIGPAIDNGFYYDFDFGENAPLDRDLAKIEQKMREILKSWKSFERAEVDTEDAQKRFAGNPYKLELIRDISEKGEAITLYTSGDFTDLCRGGHVEDASELSNAAFELSEIAGAYWRGDEKNKMLTRIYGLAFGSKDDLAAYKKMREEAEKRDHKKLGRELDLFLFSSLIGGGLPLWTPRGTLIRNLLDSRVWHLRKSRGYQMVDIPHITKNELYKTSGHWDKYKDDLFKIVTREGHEYAMKPMNCPHHAQIYARKIMSYRELPQRYASTTKVYRDEQSGELSGLTRVLSITQDDAHVFSRMNQARQEIGAIWDIIEEFYTPFGFTLRVRLSLRDPEQPEKYLGGAEKWEEAEKILRTVADERNTEVFEGRGEAAFYGPKLDFMGRDAIGREHQIATIQLDMNQPERFDLNCVNEKGEQERIVMIHAAIMGSLERFLAVLLEHTGGNLPVWLSPVQVKVLPITDTQKKYAEEVCAALTAVGLRTELDDSSETLGKKIRNAKVEKIPYYLVIGKEEQEKEMVMVESRDEGKIGAMELANFITRITEETTIV